MSTRTTVRLFHPRRRPVLVYPLKVSFTDLYPPPGQGRSGRAGSTPRCVCCAMHLPLCLCAEITPLDLETRVVVIVHRAELLKTTGTGRLVPLTLVNGEIRVRGQVGQPLEAEDLVEAERQTLLLYPTPDSVPLTADSAGGRPVTLVVPDGNWRQARKVHSRVTALAGAPRVHLPPGPPSRYRLRSHRDPRRVATFEAVARALGVLEGPEVQAALERVFDVMVERTLWTRGELAADQVTGGISPEARLSRPS